MTGTRYYPAYLLNGHEYDDAKSCLCARGCSADKADEFIAMARIHQCEIVLQAAELPPNDVFLVIAQDEGKWRTWTARAQLIRDSYDMASELLKTFPADAEWRIFRLPSYESLNSVN